MEENKAEKKKGKHFTLKFILIILIVAGLVYGFMVTDIYSKLPTKEDYSDSEYVGTWLMCGQGKYPSSEPLDVNKMTEFDGSIVNNATFFEADKVEEIMDSDEGQTLDGNGVYFLPEKRVLYENGRATCDVLHFHEKATWKPTENGVYWKPFLIGTGNNKEMKMFMTSEIKGFTPEKLGFSGDKFLVIMDNPPEGLQAETDSDIEIPEGAEIEYRTGFLAFAKK